MNLKFGYRIVHINELRPCKCFRIEKDSAPHYILHHIAHDRIITNLVNNSNEKILSLPFGCRA